MGLCQSYCGIIEGKRVMPAKKTKAEINNEAAPGVAVVDEVVTDRPTVRGRLVSPKVAEFVPEDAPPQPAPAATDEGELFFEDDEIDDEHEPTPLERLLSNLRGANDAIVYVIRRADPVAMRGRFRDPCDYQETKGQLNFEESFVDAETIDLAVQRVFGGGHYMLQIRQQGRVLKSWMTAVSDPPLHQTQATPQPFTVTPAPAVAQVDEIDGFIKTATKLQKLKEFFAPPAAPVVAALPAPAPSLADQIILEELRSGRDPDLRARAIDYVLGNPNSDEDVSLGAAAKAIFADAIKNPEQAEKIINSFGETIKKLLGQKNAQQQPQTATPDPRMPQRLNLLEVIGGLDSVMSALQEELVNYQGGGEDDPEICDGAYKVADAILDLKLPQLEELIESPALSVIDKLAGKVPVNTPLGAAWVFGRGWIADKRDADQFIREVQAALKERKAKTEISGGEPIDESIAEGEQGEL